MVPLSAATERFLTTLAERTRLARGEASPNTARTYRRVLTLLANHLGEDRQDAGRVTQEQIVDFLAAQQLRGAAPATINLYLSCLNSFFQWARREYPYRCTDNPAANVRRAQPEKEETKHLDWRQMQALLDYLAADRKARKRDLVLFELMARTGTRVSEVCRMNLDAVSLREEGVLLRLPGRARKERELLIPTGDERGQEIPAAVRFRQRLRDYLTGPRRQWKAKPGHEDALFLTNLGRRLWVRTLQSAFHYYMKKLGLEGVSLRSLRRAFIVYMLSSPEEGGAGADAAAVSRIVGHASPQVTLALYGRTDQQQLRRAMARAFAGSEQQAPEDR
jgi:site-specific recombinase XerD